MKAKFYLPLLLCLLALWFPHYAYSQVEGAPARIDYQGHVLDNSGQPLAPTSATNYTMEFRLYGAQNGGTTLWAEKQTVTVLNGDFSVRLGEGVVTDANEPHPDLSTVFNQRDRFLGITVKVPSQQSGEIVPRLAFLTSPYAFAAERAKTADSVTQAGGNSSLGTTSITSLTVSGSTNVNGNNYVQFGSGVTGKDPNAGKIGYQLFSPASLDIVGAGTDGTNRKVKIWAEGGADFNGGINVAGTVTANAFSGTFTGSGSGLTQLNGSNLISGSIDA